MTNDFRGWPCHDERVDVSWDPSARASVVIPAHDEERVIGRLLSIITRDAGRGEFDIVVVCNGCADSTAEVARRFSESVRVLETPDPSKHLALRAGDAAARSPTRIYLDADVVVDVQSLRLLVAALDAPGVLACAPSRVIPRDKMSVLVRAYYRVWERLPQVREGLFGRGVIAVSEAGHERLAGLAPVMSDDLAVSEAFAPEERVIVEEARVVVHPPRTVADLLRRRTRVVTGNAQADELGIRRPGSATTMRGLVRMAMREPITIGALPVFVGVTVAARVRAKSAIRRGDFVTWARDESSRR